MTEPTRFRSHRDNLQLNVESARFGGGVYSTGKAVQFRAGRFRTADPKLIRWLRSHELFNVGDRGFFEEPAEKPASTTPKRQKQVKPKPEAAAKRPKKRAKRAKSKPKAARAG